MITAKDASRLASDPKAFSEEIDYYNAILDFEKASLTFAIVSAVRSGETSTRVFLGYSSSVLVTNWLREQGYKVEPTDELPGEELAGFKAVVISWGETEAP